MPRITEYQSPNLDPTPQQPMERALQANEQIGRTISRFAQQDLGDRELTGRSAEQAARGGVEAADANARAVTGIAKGVGEIADTTAKIYEAHQTTDAKLSFYDETSAHEVQAQSDYKDAINQVQQNPNDPTPLIKFNMQENDWHNQLVKKYQGTDWGQERSADYVASRREVLAKSQLADMATITADDHVNKMVAFGNQQADVVMNTSEPETMYEHVKQETENYTKDLMDDDRLTPAGRQQIQAHGRELQSAYASGAIYNVMQRDPQRAIQLLNGGFGSDVLSGPMREQLLTRSAQEQRLMDSEARAKTEDQQRQQRQAYDQGTNQLFNKYTDDQGNFTGKADFIKDARSLALQPGAPAGALKSLADYAVRESAKPPAISDDRVTKDLAERAANGTLTRDDYISAVNDNSLSKEDRLYYRKVSDPAYQTQDFKDFQKRLNNYTSSMEGPISKGGSMFGQATAETKQRYSQFYNAVRDYAEDAYRTNPAAAKQIFDPQNKAYIGNIGSQFTGPPGKAASQAALQDKVNTAVTTKTPAQQKADADALDALLAKPKGSP